MNERDEWIPMIATSNTAVPPTCTLCGAAIPGVFFVRKTVWGTETLCKKCRP